MPKRINKYKVIGILILIIGLVFNEYTIKIISGHETKFETIEKSILIIIWQIILVATGIYIIKKQKFALQNIVLAIISVLILCGIIEIILTLFYSEDIFSDKPIWIPAKYVKANNKLLKEQIEKTAYNQYGFNDIKHNYEKPKGVEKRIAILGDSFIWGAGVNDTVIWTNKLKQEFKKNNKKIEVLNWGRNGWATIDEYNFLKNEGIKFQTDLVIFTFVINDPVMDGSMEEYIINRNGFIERVFFNTAGIIFPNTSELIKGLLNKFFETYFNYGYKKWFENKVYSEQNMSEYENLVKEIKIYCETKRLKLVFIMTPENHNELIKKYFDKIERILVENNIEHLNLYYPIKKELGNYSIRQLWANPADAHPNNAVTSVYAKYVYEYLLKSKLLTEDSN